MRFLCYCLILLLAACSKDEPHKVVVQIPDLLQPYVDNFVYEAGLRGEHIEITNLIIRLDPSISSCGQCNSNAVSRDVQKIITIGSATCWASNHELEALLFHEMGHCVLGREHTSDTLPNGDPKSIMVPNDISLYAPCEYQIDEKPCNKTARRPYYLDELFDPSTAVPTWGE